VNWRRVPDEGAYEAAVASTALRAAGVTDGTRAALTVDHASDWRAADMSGMLLQGVTDVFVPESVTRGHRALLARLGEIATGDPEDLSLLRLRPDRIVWWRGWTSGTVSRS